MRPGFNNTIAPLATLVLAVALAGCGSAPRNEERTSRPPRVTGPVIKSPSTGRPATGLPVLPPANSGRGGYYQDDGPGDNPPDNLDAVPDAEVRNDPLLPRSNRPYVVFGKTYTPITDNEPFTQVGLGTWYGKKFHGQRTSSGELYDMYKMTAAHPTLPIPSYARVTNMLSGATVVVRINDRGPFHSTRVIDVSYTAALKLGLLNKGSHELRVDRILPSEIDRMLATRGGVTTSTGPRLASYKGNDDRGGDDKAALVLAPRAVPATSVSSAASAASAPSARAVPASAAAPVAAPALVSASAPAPASASASALASAPASAPASALTPAPGNAEIEALMLGDHATLSSAATSTAVVTTADDALAGGFYLQLGAYSRPEGAQQLRSQLAGAAPAALQVVQSGPVFRLFSGPFASRQEAQDAVHALPPALKLKPLVIQR
ncbi:MAG: septal ring lytic transglycosylase RlpA family protein [Duganella sp.]